MTNQLTWTICKFTRDDEAAGLTYYVHHSCPTTTCSGAYYADVRRSLKARLWRALESSPCILTGRLH